jgi:hypothetical protein
MVPWSSQPDAAARPRLSRLVVLALLSAGIAAAPATAQVAGAPACLDDEAPIPDPRPGPPGLEFGIYPGGFAGQVGGDSVQARPESRSEITSAVRRLRPRDGTFTLHYYRGLGSDPRQIGRDDRDMRRRLTYWGARGFRVDYAVTYRKHDAVDEWVRLIRDIVRRFGDHPALASLQVTNEVNVDFSPDSSDGYFRGAREALVRGIVAAHREKRRLGSELQVGFNWFWHFTPEKELDFWRYLRDETGRRFVRSLDWVGLDVYPGSFSPAPGGSTARGMLAGLRSLRCFSRYARIPRSVPIHIQEVGWGTGPDRSPQQQRRELERMIRAAHRYRGTFNLTKLNWFSLRDSVSSVPSFQQQWGLLRDDYEPKPAFAAYRRLIARLGRR